VRDSGFFARLRARVNRGTSWVADLLPGRRIDAELLDELETRLLQADVGVEATQEILADLHKKVARAELADAKALEDALASALLAILKPVERQLAVDRARKPFVILVVGVNGSGKTTTIGKLARLLKGQGLSVLLAAGDTFRAAAVEQLRTWGARAGVEVVGGAEGSDPAAVAFDAYRTARDRGVDTVIVDTAGRLHSKKNLMAELGKVANVLRREAGAVTDQASSLAPAKDFWGLRVALAVCSAACKSESSPDCPRLQRRVSSSKHDPRENRQSRLDQVRPPERPALRRMLRHCD
jgi:fused signal recognition particle receptor